MTQTLTMSKNVDVEMEVVIYDVECECGAQMDFTSRLDDDHDVRIEVKRCENPHCGGK